MSGLDSLIKKAYKKQSYTYQQLREFAACADPITGPEYFLRNFFYIQHPTRGKLQFDPFPYQEDLIHLASTC